MSHRRQKLGSVYRKIKLWDLCDLEIYIKIKNPLREEFFRYLLKTSGGYKKLSNKVGITFGHIYDQRKGRYFTSLKIIKKFLDICPENKRSEFKDKIENNIEEIKVGSRSTSIKNPKFPISFSPTLARIAGHLVGDGGIKNNLIVHYTNACSSLLDEFHKDILEIFGDVKYGEYIHVNKEHIKTVWFPRIIGLLLRKIFGQQVKGLKHVPKIIFEVDNNSKASFLRALFDDEGYVNVKSYVISIEMAGKKLVEDIKILLKELGISTGRTATIKRNYIGWRTKYQNKIKYQFYISGKLNLKQFSELINFNHPKKKEKLRILIQKYRH
jgi:hypothetical protein